MCQKLKPFLANDTLFYGVLLIFVGVTSFGLGRQSILEVNAEKSVVKQQNVAKEGSAPTAPTLTPLTPTPIEQVGQSATTSVDTTAEQVVASKSGSKYHLPTCPGAKQIKPENLITFDSPQAAQAAGYSAASNCKF